jgi:hypothetical protein
MFKSFGVQFPAKVWFMSRVFFFLGQGFLGGLPKKKSTPKNHTPIPPSANNNHHHNHLAEMAPKHQYLVPVHQKSATGTTE